MINNIVDNLLNMEISTLQYNIDQGVQRNVKQKITLGLLALLIIFSLVGFNMAWSNITSLVPSLDVAAMVKKAGSAIGVSTIPQTSNNEQNKNVNNPAGDASFGTTAANSAGQASASSGLSDEKSDQYLNPAANDGVNSVPDNPDPDDTTPPLPDVSSPPVGTGGGGTDPPPPPAPEVPPPIVDAGSQVGGVVNAVTGLAGL